MTTRRSLLGLFGLAAAAPAAVIEAAKSAVNLKPPTVTMYSASTWCTEAEILSAQMTRAAIRTETLARACADQAFTGQISGITSTLHVEAGEASVTITSPANDPLEWIEWEEAYPTPKGI